NSALEVDPKNKEIPKLILQANTLLKQ
ncbi:MAG: hypothetical protein ACI9E5_001404, partial [Candidatus Omnitrophota bacterium]